LKPLLAVLLLCLLAGCSTTKPTVREPTFDVDLRESPSRVSPEQAVDVSIYALGLVGTPYRYGGNTPQTGFDCSGLIGHVYQLRAGVAAPRTVARLQFWGHQVAAEHVRSGDLVFFAKDDNATHAGIYVGEGRFVHAPSTGGEVRLDRLSSKYWRSQQVIFRRP